VQLADIKRIGVLGAGVMGGGIAQTAILAGFPVIVRDLRHDILDRVREQIVNGQFGLEKAIQRGKLTREQRDAALARLSGTVDVGDLHDCDLVIEAIGGSNPAELENKDLKFRVFRELDAAVKPEAIFASNSSRFTIADLAAVTKRRDRFIGMHWFRPANIMKAVEIIWTAEVSPDVISVLEQLCDRFGKVHVRVKDVPGDTGFVGNRIMGAARAEARKIVAEGIATADDVNAVMTGGFNWPLGPFPSAAQRKV
jgi:3-hydroxybutyryl-CoA dehydrogenase